MEIDVIHTIVVAVFVLYLGIFLINKLPILKKYNLPAPVVGGLLVSLLAWGIYSSTGIEISFNLQYRDTFMLAFFATIGLGAKLSMLKRGGKPLVILVLVSILFLIIQNGLGILLAVNMGLNPLVGLLSGSVSLVGGHGTTISYGKVFTEHYGMLNATEIGVMCATFGLVLGGLMAGPMSRFMIKKYNLHGQGHTSQGASKIAIDTEKSTITVHNTINGIALIAICIALGHNLNDIFKAHQIIMPDFLAAMFIGIILINIIDLFKIKKVDTSAISLLGEVSLLLFLAMSLMSLQLWTLANIALPILLILCIQALTALLLVYYLVFRLLGKDYDACVISAGYIGLSLGATPVAMANMDAISQRYGYSAVAFLVIPIIGAFFIDILNAIHLQSFLALPIFKAMQIL